MVVKTKSNHYCQLKEDVRKPRFSLSKPAYEHFYFSLVFEVSVVNCEAIYYDFLVRDIEEQSETEFVVTFVHFKSGLANISMYGGGRVTIKREGCGVGRAASLTLAHSLARCRHSPRRADFDSAGWLILAVLWVQDQI